MWLAPNERMGWLRARLEEWCLAPEAFPLPTRDILWCLDGSKDPCAELVRDLLVGHVPLHRALVPPEPIFAAWHTSECAPAMVTLLHLWVARAPSSLTRTAWRVLRAVGDLDKVTPDQIRAHLLVPPSLEEFLAHPLRTKAPMKGFLAPPALDNLVTVP